MVIGFKKARGQLGMSSSIHLYGCVLRKEDDHVLSKVVGHEVEGRMSKGKSKSTRKGEMAEESMKVTLSRQEVALV